MAIIYRKTAKGAAEVETRAHRLAPRMRAVLILVDGKRSDTELASMILQGAVETLHALAGQGFIEVLTVAAPPQVAPPAPAAPARPAAPAPAPAGIDLQARRREAVRVLNDLVGPAGESFAVSIERARNVEELRAALSRAQKVIGNTRGQQAAAAFAARFIDV